MGVDDQSDIFCSRLPQQYVRILRSVENHNLKSSIILTPWMLMTNGAGIVQILSTWFGYCLHSLVPSCGIVPTAV